MSSELRAPTHPLGQSLPVSATTDFSHSAAESQPTILFAEDNEDLRTVTHYLLSLMGYKVVACQDGDAAAAAFQGSGAVDMLLTDFDMPGRNGLELARELTAIRPSLPVVIISGSILSDEQVGEMDGRSWAFLSKPCLLPTLLQSLSSALQPLGPA